VSGSKESRPALNRLMTDAHRRRFEIVLCWKIDNGNWYMIGVSPRLPPHAREYGQRCKAKPNMPC